jgi:hypothetical protein
LKSVKKLKNLNCETFPPYIKISKSNIKPKYYTLKSMVVIRISYHQLNSIWAQIGHELTMNVGENILHGADLLQIFYRGLSKSNFKSIYCTSISMMFIKNKYPLLHSIWSQIGHDLMMNMGVEILHGANLLQSFFLRSHLPTKFPTKLPPTLNIKPVFSPKSISKMASVTLEDYLASQPHILEPYISSEIAETGSLPSIMCKPDLNFWKEALNTHSNLHQVRKDCSCYHACQPYLMPDAVNIQTLTSSLKYRDIPSEITEVDPLLSLIREQLSKNPPVSAIALLAFVFPGKIIITSRIFYYPQVIFNGYYSLKLSLSMLFSNSRQIQYCIWNSSVVPKQFFTTLIQLSQRVLCPFIRPFSWLVTYVTEPTNYSASTRDVASDQQLMFSSVCGIHLNPPELLLALSTYWHQQPVRGEFESYLLHVFVNRIHNDLALQTKSLSTSAASLATTFNDIFSVVANPSLLVCRYLRHPFAYLLLLPP